MAFLLPAKSRLLLLSALLLLLCPSPPPVLLCCLSPPSPPHCRAAPPEQSGGERSPQRLESPRPRQCVWGGCWPQWGKAGCHHCDVGLSHCDLRLSQRGCTHPPRPAPPCQGGSAGDRGFRDLPPPHGLLTSRGFPRLGLTPAMSPHGDTRLEVPMGFLLPFPASSCLSYPKCLQWGAAGSPDCRTFGSRR